MLWQDLALAGSWAKLDPEVISHLPPSDLMESTSRAH